MENAMNCSEKTSNPQIAPCGNDTLLLLWFIIAKVPIMVLFLTAVCHSLFVVCWKGPWTKSSKVQSPIFILEFNSSPKTNFQPLKLLPGAGRGGRWTGKRDRLKTLTWRSICAVPNLTPHNMTYARDTNTDSFFWIKGNFKLGWDNISLFYTSLKNKQYNFLMN